MFQPKIKRYQKEFTYSYAFGAYPVIELLKSHPESVLKVLFKEDSFKDGNIPAIQKECEKRNIHTQINNKLIDKISVKENTYVVGVFKKYASKIKEDENHIVLVNPSNTGNLGTILRTMLGFDFKNLAIIKPAVDMFDPLVVRASMGAVFSINFEYFNNIEEYVLKFSAHHLYPFMLNGKSSVENVKFVKPYSIIHGNESKGLDEKYLELGESVYIPHSKDIDSLNLSIAAGISMWEAVKKEM
ncbi:MAG TPA: TrmH family RNA methyltransferase [Candidatus Dojkabacteria bacterium]|jgi:TrmH family RNA methyltransferase|nr:TrmH family RNA methyltransferase [Candidatus Dojkabacteria bacterium]